MNLVRILYKVVLLLSYRPKTAQGSIQLWAPLPHKIKGTKLFNNYQFEIVLI